jgi:cell shape-determining protein MreD
VGVYFAMNWLNTILILALAYVAVFLEGSFDVIRNLLGAQITLLPALMVYASLTAEIGTVALLAVCGGLWRDSFSIDPLGASILPLMVIGYIIMWKRDLLLREYQFVQMALGLAAGAVFPLATLFLLLNVGREPLLGWGLVWQCVVGTLTGGVLAPLLFGLFSRVRRAIEYPALNQSSFREDREIKRGRQ